MADQTLAQIRAGSPASALDGTEVLYVLQGGANAGALASQVKTLAVGAGSVAIASGKTLTGSNTLTFVGTDGTTITFPTTSATVARTDAANTFTGLQTFNGGAKMASGQALTLGNAATTGLGAGVLAALTNASIVITDSTGQAYRIPAII